MIANSTICKAIEHCSQIKGLKELSYTAITIGNANSITKFSLSLLIHTLVSTH